MRRSIAIVAAWLALAGPADAQPTPADDQDPPAEDPDSRSPDEPPIPKAEPEEEGDDPVSAPLAGDGVTPLPLPEPSRPLPVRTGEAPPRQWSEFAIEGELLEPEDTVLAFLEPMMRLKRGALTRQARQEIAEFLRSIGYYLADLKIRRRGDGQGSLLVLVLEPEMLVYRVAVNTGQSFLGRLAEGELPRLVDLVLEDELLRRMRLRTGAALAHDPETRRAQLQGEAERLADYLRNQGYFESDVRVTTKPHGRHAAVVHVDIDLGPRYRVGHVRVLGNDAIPTPEIIDQFHHDRVCLLAGIFGDLTCFGIKPFTREQLNQDVQSVTDLYQRRGYPGVRVRTDFDLRHSFKRDTRTVEFTVIIHERRKLDVIFVSEENELDENRLRELLTFSEEGSYDEVEVRASAEAIRRFYQGRGRFEAKVTWERLRFDFFDRIIYHIDPGPPLQVRSVQFDGNEAFSDDRLEDVVRTDVYRPLALFDSGGSNVTSARLGEDVRRLRTFYRRRGFPEARVRVRVTRDQRLIDNSAALAATVAAEIPSDDLYVQFLIDEGPRHVVEAVRFEFVTGTGEETTSEHLDELRQRVSLQEGDPYYEDRETEEVAKLERYYFQQGYPHAKVDTHVEPGSNEERRVVVFRVEELHPVRFGKVIIRGNFRTRDWVIRDELGYGEGQLLTLARAERGQQNLRTSGLFNGVQVGLLDFENRHLEDINVVVQVEERHPGLGDGELAGGFSTDQGAFVEGGLTLPNLFGIGLRSSTRLTVGVEADELADPTFEDVQLFFEEKLQAPRWIARRAVGLGVQSEASAFVRRDITERFGPLTSIGSTVGFSRAGRRGFFEGWVLSLRYDFRRRNRDEDLVRAPGASDDLSTSPVTTQTSGPAVQLVIDRRRDQEGRINPLTPVKGFKLDLRAMYAEDVLLGSDSFVKLGASGQQFWKPADRVLLSNTIRYDHGIPLPLGSALLPEVERFFAGGDTTVRGFEEDRLATEIVREPLPPYGDTSSIRVLPAGGNIRFVHNLDLQVNVWELWSFPVASALFLDTGLVTNSLDRFEPDDLRHAVGAALFRWLSPVGAFSVEWALPLDPEPGDDPRGRFHFNFGLLLP